MPLRERQFFAGIPYGDTKVFQNNERFLVPQDRDIYVDPSDRSTRKVQAVTVVDEETLRVDAIKTSYDPKTFTHTQEPIVMVFHGQSITHFLEKFRRPVGRWKERRYYWEPK